MADHNIEIRVGLEGRERTISGLQDIKGLVDSLDGKSVSLRLATAQFDKEIQSVKREIDSLERQKKDLSLSLNFKGDATKKVPELEKQLESLRAEYDRLYKLSGGNFSSKELMDLSSKIKATEKELADAKGIKELDDQIQSLIDKRNQLTDMKAELRIESNAKEAAAEIDTVASKAERLASILETASSVFSAAGAVSSTLGDFGGWMASSVQAMSGMFSFDALSTAKRYITAMATRAITGQISGMIQRYDIMSTFDDYMEAAGVSKLDADAALNAVDQSIRGIPIGLDEAAFRLRKYQMYLGDIDLTRDFTIGIQKAITAGGASEQMKNMAYTQIDRLLATGQLGQSRQWLSLFNGLGVSLRFLKEELGLDANADLRTVARDLANGTIPVENFINAIARLSDNQGLDNLIEIYKGTLEAWQSNINNAIKRGGQNIMQSVNDVMESTVGFGITGAMEKIRDGIDTVSKGAGNYIKDNPQHVRTIGGAVQTLLDRVMTLDGGRFVDNVIGHIGDIAQTVSNVIAQIPPGFLEDFAAFATTWAGPLGTLMMAAQSGLGAVLGVFERLDKMDISRLVSKITREIERMAKIVSKLLDFIPDGLLGDLMAMGLVWGRPLARVFGTIASALSLMSGSIRDIASTGGASGVLGLLFKGVSAIGAGPVLAIAGAFTALAIGMHEAKEARDEWLQEVDDKYGLGEIEDNLSSLQETTDAIESSFQSSQEAYEKETAAIKANADEAHRLLDEILKTDQEMSRTANPDRYQELYDKQYENISKLLQIYPELSSAMELDSVGRLVNIKALQEQGDAYIDYVEKIAQANAAQQAYESTYATFLEAQAQKSVLDAQKRGIEDRISVAEAQVAIARAAQASLSADPNMFPDKDFSPESQLRWLNQLKVGEYAEDALPQLYADLANVNSQLISTNAVLGDSEEVSDMLYDTWKDLDGEADGMVPTIEELQTIITSGAEDAAMTIEETADSIMSSLSDTAKAYKELRDSAKESLQSQIDLLKELNTEADKSLNDTLSPLQSNVERLTNQDFYANVIQDWLRDPKNGLTEGSKKAISWLAWQLMEQGNVQALGELASRGGSVREDGSYNNTDYYTWLTGLMNGLDGYDVSKVVDNTASQQAKFQLQSQYGIEEVDQAAEETNLAEAAVAALTISQETGTPTAETYGAAQGLVAGANADINANDPSSTIQASGEAAGEATGPTEELAGATQKVASNAQQAASNSDAMKSSINQAGSSALAKTAAMFMFSASLALVSAQASSAESNVSSLADAIDRLTDKTITIRVNMSAGGLVGSVGGFGAGLSSFGGVFAKGGLVDYLAEGGFPGIGRGTDTIPTWLTPGEYVMKRSAVGMFGSRFMDRINKMDIGGAFDALMSRISNPMHMGGNTYNRDNHATVNNYFYGDNGQNYSQRKAYRYAGSL